MSFPLLNLCQLVLKASSLVSVGYSSELDSKSAMLSSLVSSALDCCGSAVGAVLLLAVIGWSGTGGCLASTSALSSWRGVEGG